MQYDFCCVGHITLDKVTTPHHTAHMPGGTSFYCAQAIHKFNDINFKLVTSVAASEMDVVEQLRSKGIDVDVMPSKHSHYFENIYGEDQNNRTQRVLAKADPFTIESVSSTNANVYLLGALMSDDFSVDIVRYLATKGLVAIDSQGYLREVRDTQVYPIDWANKVEILQYVQYLKANEEEMEILTGHKDVKKAAQQLFDWGVKEVLITMGSMGSIIFDGTNYFEIPAYQAKEVVDATGCGDTYMTGYLYKRVKGASIEDSARFGAAMATIKIEGSGPFNGDLAMVEHEMQFTPQHLPHLI